MLHLRVAPTVPPKAVPVHSLGAAAAVLGPLREEELICMSVRAHVGHKTASLSIMLYSNFDS